MLGDVIFFEKAKLNISGDINLTGTSDFSAILINTLPTVDQANPDSSNFTEVAIGGAYTGAVALTTTWSLEAGKAVFKVASPDPLQWLAEVGSPVDIRAILIYSEIAVEDALFAIDVTSDGGITPHSLVEGKLSWTPNAGGVFKF